MHSLSLSLTFALVTPLRHVPAYAAFAVATLAVAFTGSTYIGLANYTYGNYIVSNSNGSLRRHRSTADCVPGGDVVHRPMAIEMRRSYR